MYLLLDDGPADGYTHVLASDVPPQVIFVQMAGVDTPCEISTVYLEPPVQSWGDGITRGEIPYKLDLDHCSNSSHRHYKATTLYALLRNRVMS